MSDLVVGGTGNVGRGVVQGLLEAGREVRVLTRAAERARDLAGAPGVVVGDLLDPRSYAAVFAGVERMFLVNALSQSELHEGLVAVNEARRAGVRHLVYLSVLHAERGPHVPHFASKQAIEAAIRASGVPYTILRPANFFQNDLWLKDAILGYGVYPQPIGETGIARVDVGDVADAAVRALTGAGHEGRSYSLVAPGTFTGPGTAERYAAALRREVRYGGDDLGAWERVMLASRPAWLIYELKLMYALFQEEGLTAGEAELAETRAILGREPHSFADFVGETTRAWTTDRPIPMPTPG
jgi:uncharacterized protein YbjT (DUF2867 family)